MSWILAILVIILLIIIIIIFYTVKNKDSTKRKQSKELYNSSSGNYDKEAYESLKKISEIKDKKPDDNFLAGNIIEYNVLQGNIRKAPKEPFMNMLSNYNETIRGIQENKIVDEIDPIYMLDHITTVYNQIALPNIAHVEQIAPNIIHIPEIRKNVVKERKNKIKTNTSNKKEEINVFLEASKSFTSDPQNTHDSSVNGDLRKTVKELQSTYPQNLKSFKDSLDEIRKYIETAKIPEFKKEKAKKSLDLAYQNNYILTLNCKEGDILSMTWERSKHENNKNNCELIKNAILDSLVDCISDNGLSVCINGRCGRILESLTTLDFYKDIGKAQTSEMYKNEIFNEAKKIMDSFIEQAEQSKNEKLQNLARNYKGENVEVDNETDKKFKSEISNNIDKMTEKYKEKLSADQLKIINNQCKQAIE